MFLLKNYKLYFTYIVNILKFKLNVLLFCYFILYLYKILYYFYFIRLLKKIYMCLLGYFLNIEP